MVWIQIDDEAWTLYKKSWALMDVKTHAGLVRMLERYMEESSKEVIDYAEHNLLSDEPEALFLREVGLMKEKLLKQLVELGFSREVVDKSKIW